MNYVIIGNSAAAVGCVEGIRQQDREGNITILSSEPHHTYSRPLISYLLQGKTDRQRIRYRPESFYADNGVTFLPGVTVTELIPDAHAVKLADGKVLDYDRLLVATGSSPAMPPIPGLDSVKRKTAFMTLDDAAFLEENVKPGTRVLILGAGLIGLKCAEGLSKKTADITVVDLADHILPSILDAESAEPVQRHLLQNGIHLMLGDSVESFEKDTAKLKSGEALRFDVLVVAAGVRPNTELVKAADGTVEKGIVTDEFCRTSLPDVYAAGDCAQSVDVTTGENRVLALLPNAWMQGECAGIHMAGGKQPYNKAISMNAIGFFGYHIISAGSYIGTEYRSETQDSARRLFYEDNLLKGYILTGDVARAGIYTALIREQTPLDSIDFDLIKDRPQLMAFSRRERQKKLGGVGA